MVVEEKAKAIKCECEKTDKQTIEANYRKIFGKLLTKEDIAEAGAEAMVEMVKTNPVLHLVHEEFAVLLGLTLTFLFDETKKEED